MFRSRGMQVSHLDLLCLIGVLEMSASLEAFNYVMILNIDLSFSFSWQAWISGHVPPSARNYFPECVSAKASSYFLVHHLM